MDTILVVPAQLVGELREGVCGELRRSCEALCGVIQTPGNLEHPEWYRECRADFDAKWALLDAIGWEAGEVSIELGEHGVLVLAAFRGQLGDAEHALEDVREGRETDPAKSRAMLGRAERLRWFIAGPNGPERTGAV
jgi:hypothetical protein